MTHVAVVTGGSTPERHVAFAGAAQVVAALRGAGYQVSVIDTLSGALSPEEERQYLVPSVGRSHPTSEELQAWSEQELGVALIDTPQLRDCDLVFIVLHGRGGEGGEVQALLELSGIAYAGSDPLGSALAMDKDISKRLFHCAGIPTPDWLVWPADGARIAAFGFPLIVKPSKVGSAVGLSVVHSTSEVEAAVQNALAYDNEVILERYVSGREFTVGILGERALAVGEIRPKHKIFDYECKYTPGMCDEIFPAPLDEHKADELRNLSAQAHRALKLRDFSRVDFKVDNDGTPYCLEVNTLPGLTATSLLPQSAEAAGVTFTEMCDTICSYALRRARSRNKVGI